MTTRIGPPPPPAPAGAGAAARPPVFLEVGEGAARRRIAVLFDRRGETALLWLGGYGSDMRGAKAERLDTLSATLGLTFGRFDYSGHGESDGDFASGTITRWTEEAEAVEAGMPGARLILAGSSMGAWIAIRLVERLRAAGRGGRVAGLLLLAPAPDFTARLVEPKLTDAQRRDLVELGYCTEPSPYAPTPTVYTQALMDDGRRNLVMDRLIETGCPVHIIQGMMDREVPYAHALDLVAQLPAEGVTLTLVRDGDHRLSRPDDLDRLDAAVRQLVGMA